MTLKTSAKRAQAIIVSSKFEYEDALEFGIPKDKIHIIPMGIKVNDLDKDKTLTDTLQLLFVGRIARVRRLELLLQAVEKLTIPFHLTIAGGEEKTSSVTRSGYMKELTKLTEKLNLNSKVTFTGRKSQEELKTLYEMADLFVYPSEFENFGQPLIEAGAHGLPLIATPVGVARDIVIEGETGYLTPSNPEAISDRIQLLQDDKLRKQMGVQIKSLIKEKFDWGNIMSQYISLYNSL
ncbi:MAG: glycosyltransferase family 4 protein [Nitrospina sp.]|jgi:glycosyltransferase involved in cell wall biosynthesis|nr:glycosyltransferase family 4 protein [Nitrospina sp.]MBT3414289.1 glycosyltransferase family 4 protein [Nitrospina sp.]MBT3855476.1 glycosyltransferase family 4 protein [Nitrospina sp.]MBT4103679.1 glycosyltransferase family 4 protein [Nitrospina sp.]MBT4388408.1 glycosyltransferase family 4 protein [Nitrospina sp.]